MLFFYDFALFQFLHSLEYAECTRNRTVQIKHQLHNCAINVELAQLLNLFSQYGVKEIDYYINNLNKYLQLEIEV